jgi:LTXXQ motif family protein
MSMLRKLALVGGLAMMAALPAMAQQTQQQMPMTGQGGMMGQGMMGQGNPSMMGPGMMSQGMMGPGSCFMMGGMGPMMMGSGMQGMMNPTMMGMMMGGGPMMGMMGAGPMMEGRLAYQKAELGISDAQAAAWDNYVAAFRTRGAAMQSMHADMMQIMQSGNAMARLDAHIKAMETMVDSLKALKPATGALYAVLTDDQKAKADQLLGGCGMM